MKRFVIHQLIIVVIFLIIISSCDNSRIFEDYQSISESGWHKDSLVIFNILIFDTLQNHNLLVNVRNDMTYKYSNLWLFIEIDQPGGVVLKDTFELSLAHPSGKWLGDGFGGFKTRQVMYRRNVYFPASGNYKINVQHGMRDDKLAGISDIGFRVENLN